MHAKFKPFVEWYSEEEEFREPKTQAEWGRINRVSVATVAKWIHKIKENRTGLPVGEVEEFTQWCKEVAYSAKGTSKDRELYAKLNGWLLEKKEDKKNEPIASDYIRWSKQLIEELRRQRGGSCPMCGGLQEVSEEPRIHTDEGEAAEGNEVGSVGLSARPV